MSVLGRIAAVVIRLKFLYRLYAECCYRNCFPTKSFFFVSVTDVGFLKEEELGYYQRNVLEVNTECWLPRLRHLTFPTSYSPISFPEAQLFIACYERTYRDRTPGSTSSKAWRQSLNQSEASVVAAMADRLSVALESYLKQDGYVFVKTSSRSAKDAPVYEEKFKRLYEAELKEADEQQQDENHQIINLLKAAFQALKIASAEEVIDTFMSSERIYQDFLLATKQRDHFEENFVIRTFTDIDVDMEFRRFVHKGKLTCVSQYNYLVHSKRLCAEKEKIASLLNTFFATEVKPCLEQDPGFPGSYIIDFAVCNPGRSCGLHCVVY